MERRVRVTAGIWLGQRRMTKPITKANVWEEGDRLRGTGREDNCGVKHSGQKGHTAIW